MFARVKRELTGGNHLHRTKDRQQFFRSRQRHITTDPVFESHSGASESIDESCPHLLSFEASAFAKGKSLP